VLGPLGILHNGWCIPLGGAAADPGPAPALVQRGGSLLEGLAVDRWHGARARGGPPPWCLSPVALEGRRPRAAGIDKPGDHEQAENVLRQAVERYERMGMPRHRELAFAC
jgi:hypothetical protein